MAKTSALTILLVLAPAWSRAQESLDDIEKAKTTPTDQPQRPEVPMGSRESKAVSEVNGYLDTRFQGTGVRTGGLLPTQDVPTWSMLAEGNIQLKVFIGRSAFVYSDLSLFYQTGGLYYAKDASGKDIRVPDHDVPSLRPLIVPAELYVSYGPRPWLSLLAGRKRIIWGGAFAFNPTDLINPPKDPTDPSFQRAGAWLFRAEAPLEKLTVS